MGKLSFLERMKSKKHMKPTTKGRLRLREAVGEAKTGCFVFSVEVFYTFGSSKALKMVFFCSICVVLLSLLLLC